MALSIAEDFVIITPQTVSFTFDGTSAFSGPSGLITLPASEFLHFGAGILGSLQEIEVIAFPNPPIEEEAAATLPPTADPPFPPVWPYPFVGGLIYGREHLGMNLKFFREDDFRFDFVVVDENGDPYDLSTAELTLRAKWNVRDSDGNAVFICTSNPANGITITDAAAGEVSVTIASSKTSSLPLHRVFLSYQVLMVDATLRNTVLSGTLRIDPNVNDT